MGSTQGQDSLFLDSSLLGHQADVLRDKPAAPKSKRLVEKHLKAQRLVTGAWILGRQQQLVLLETGLGELQPLWGLQHQHWEPLQHPPQGHHHALVHDEGTS